MVRCSLRLHRIGRVLIHELVPQASTSELDQSRSPRRRRELDRSRLGTSAQGSSTPSSSPSRDPSLTSEPSQLSWRVEVRTVGGGQEDLVQRRTGRVTSGDRWDLWGTVSSYVYSRCNRCRKDMLINRCPSGCECPCRREVCEVLCSTVCSPVPPFHSSYPSVAILLPSSRSLVILSPSHPSTSRSTG
jgi:hypothetical protein